MLVERFVKASGVARINGIVLLTGLFYRATTPQLLLAERGYRCYPLGYCLGHDLVALPTVPSRPLDGGLLMLPEVAQHESVSDFLTNECIPSTSFI